MSASDADLVRRCLAGDRLGWADLLGKYADLIHGVLHRAGLDRTSAADAFQEVSVLLWKGLKGLRKTDSLVPWIATTAKRIAWRTKQRGKARHARDASVARPEADTAEGPAERLAVLDDEQRVREALGRLGERCRRLLTALYFHPVEGGYDAVAADLGMPRGSIGPTRQRCLEHLRRELLAAGYFAEGRAPDGPGGGPSTVDARPGEGGPPAPRAGGVSPSKAAASPPARDVPPRRRGPSSKGPP